MAIQDIYSKRDKPLPDVFSYDNLPLKLKNQVVHIWKDSFEQLEDDLWEKVWEIVESTIAKEHGLKTLLSDGFSRYRNSYKVEHYFENNQNVDECLDIIEIVFRGINKIPKALNQHYSALKYAPKEAIHDLNTRFLENSIGFELNQGKIIKVDNNLLHQGVIQPVLSLLMQKEYENANEEFLNAHEHFRYKRNEECLNDCLKAFETTMKIIITKNKWGYDEKDTANKLINNLLKNGFLPEYHESQFNAMKLLLESGIPTIRNKKGGHGQGVSKVVVDDSLASYMLYITGATIKLLVDTQNSKSITT